MKYENLILFEKWDNILKKYVRHVVGIDEEDTFESTIFLSKFILEKLNLTKESVIVDVGCGNGRFPDICTEYSDNVIGIEPDIICIKSAKKKDVNNKVCFINGSFENLNFDDKADFVTSSLVFHKVPYEKRALALQNVKNILKDDGLFILCDVFIMFDPYKNVELFDKSYRYLLENTTPEHIYRKNIEPYMDSEKLYSFDDMKKLAPKDNWFYSLDEFSKLLDGAGLKIKDKYEICDFFGILAIENK